MPKYKLIKDLPFQKADDSEWDMIGTYGKIKSDYPEPIYFSKEGTSFKWPIDWGDPLTSGWFEEVKPKRWRAESGCYYYCIFATGVRTLAKEVHAISDDQCYETGNYFRTKEQAEEALKRIKKLLAENQEKIYKE